jgi:two-component system NtrC family response regulator
LYVSAASYEVQDVAKKLAGPTGKSMRSILIIDDEQTLRGLLARIIQLEGYTVFQATTIKEGLKLLSRETINVVVSDVKLPDGNGVDLTAKIKAEYPAIEIIVITAFGTIEDGVKAIKNGAFDYLTKGDHQERIIPLLNKASEKATLQQQVLNLESKVRKKFGFESVIGNSPAIKASLELARKVAGTDTSVLLLGETGTGKEVFAQAIHYQSNRSTKPFIGFNCSAFPKDLLESELFGHAEGAFTGAVRSKKGLLEEAQEGTLFLDEIGEMTIDLQAKLLRVVESREYFRVGDAKPRQANVRFITATNRDLESDIKEGKFREDLYYRFSVFVIHLPSLRERKEDIGLLVSHFVNDFSNKINRKSLRIDASFLNALEKHPWKGNIRELKNVIERCVILSDSNELTADILPFDFNANEENSLTLESMEKQHIQKVLNVAGGNKTHAAKLLDIGLTTLYQKLKDYGI